MNAKPWWNDPDEIAEHEALRQQFKADNERFNIESQEAEERFRELTAKPPLFPEWRKEELMRKYAAPDAYEPDDVEDDE